MRMMVALTALLAAGIVAVLWYVPEMDGDDLSATIDAAQTTVAEEGPLDLATAEPSAPAAPEGAELAEPSPAAQPDAAASPVETAEAPGDSPDLTVPGLSPEAETAVPAEDPAPAEAAVAEAPAPGLPEDPLDPTDALTSLAPDLATPAAPPVRRGTAAPGAPAAEVPTGTAAPEGPAFEPARAPVAAAPPGTRRVTGDRVNLRADPSTEAERLGTLARDDAVEVLEDAGDWLRVRTSEGEEGWVAARFLAGAG